MVPLKLKVEALSIKGIEGTIPLAHLNSGIFHLTGLPTTCQTNFGQKEIIVYLIK